MNSFEKWSLALTAIGYLFVALSILYAARQWSVAEKSLDREIIRDTRAHISEIRRRINHYQTEIIEREIDPSDLDIGSPDFIPVRLLLNLIEEIAADLDSDFYDNGMLEIFARPLAVAIWHYWKPVIVAARAEIQRADAWAKIEFVANKYPDLV